MKVTLHKNLILLLLLNSICAIGQVKIEKNENYLKTLNIKEEYKADITELQKEHPNAIFNSKFLNLFFTNEITSFATGIKDQSVEKYFINANTDNKSLAIGRSFDICKIFCGSDDKELQKMENILTIYTQSGLDKGFSTIYEKNTTTDEFNWSNNLGLGFRITHFFNGIISYDVEKKEKISRVNDKLLDDYVKANIGIHETKGKDVTITVNKSIVSDIEFIEETESSSSDSKAKVDKYTKKKYNDTYKAIISKQIETLKSEKLYTRYIAFWVGADFYKPLTDKIVISTLDSINIEKNKFRDWRFEAFGNVLVNYSSGTSIKLKGVFSNFNSNDFVLKNATPLTIQDIRTMNPTTQVLNKTNSAYYGLFDDKAVSTVKAELVILFANNSFGISGGIEDYLHYKITNWKLGFPFSLKDKENKPTVNFEVVWREINKSHVVGINAVYSFGKFL